MGKKSSGKTYVSKGERNCVSTVTRRDMRRNTSEADKLLNKQRAWMKGSDPWVTIANPNKEEKDKPFIRVRYSVLQKGTYKDREKYMKVMK